MSQPSSELPSAPDADPLPPPSRSGPIDAAQLEQQAAARERIGRYQVLEVREVGKHRRLVLAEELDGGPPVAVEVLTGLVGRGGSVFRQQLNRLRRLEHPALDATLDGGWCEAGPYFVREASTGPTLEQSTLELRDAARVLEAAALACAAAHRAGLVHGDVRAARIAVGARPQLTGFGAAAVLAAVGVPEPRAQDSGAQDSGVTTMSAGTADVGPAADVHALGVLLDQQLAAAAAAALDVTALVELARAARAPRADARPSAATFAKRLRRWREAQAEAPRSSRARARVAFGALAARASRWARAAFRPTTPAEREPPGGAASGEEPPPGQDPRAAGRPAPDTDPGADERPPAGVD